MFFRRERARVATFDERIEGLRGAGFSVTAEGSGQVRVSRGECAAVIGRDASGDPRLDRCGILIGGEVAVIVDAGNQKFLETASGRRRPALASHLTALHAFTEEVRELLGLKSLYNESLGTVSQSHHYDRVKGRESEATQASGGGYSLCGRGADSMTWREGSNAMTRPLR